VEASASPILSAVTFSYAREVSFTQQDRDRLIRLEVKLEEIDKRFEQIDKRFEQMMTFMWMLIAIFVGITGVTIGFAIWDRRTMIRPFEIKIRDIEAEIANDRNKLHSLIEAFRSLAKTDEKVAEVLRKLRLL